ncbi:MAG: hypothetical protein A2452_06710 [Candidatus Firestonebacteria bacterium RIFOXYC2_FULL_39_67]|nr:MAG: hypothetical protein A2452_06710 [Candidatus Firestonebacteria bacterium RIFOXYC2_FULL_39_67]
MNRNGSKLLGIMVLVLGITGCATFNQIPLKVEETSICKILDSGKDFDGKKVLISGKSNGSYGKGIFELQCQHDTSKSVLVDASEKGVMPVEFSNRAVKVFGKVTVSKYSKVTIIAEATEVGGSMIDGMPGGNSRGGGGGGGCH